MSRIKSQALLIFVALLQLGCTSNQNDYLLVFDDTIKNEYSYISKDGKTIIEPGKYLYCYTDTFRTFAFVYTKDSGLVAINRNEEVLYKVFNYDNGPDYAEDGLFRIIKNNKIGYADELTGKIIIEPQFDCASSFEDGKAKVSNECFIKTAGEHSYWESNNWFYIDKKGLKLPLN